MAVPEVELLDALMDLTLPYDGHRLPVVRIRLAMDERRAVVVEPATNEYQRNLVKLIANLEGRSNLGAQREHVSTTR